MERNSDNDNDTWQPISLAAGRLLLELSEQHQPDTERDRADDDEKQNKGAEREEYVAQRIKEIARFEQRYSEDRKRSSR